jgi:N-acetylglutamate synthase-like GNAT family acetyltransferase
MKNSAIYAMGKNCDAAWMPILIKEMASPNPDSRYEAAGACGEICDEEAVPYLIKLTEDKDLEVQLAAIQSLGQIGGVKAKQHLLKCLKSQDDNISEAAGALKQVETKKKTLLSSINKIPFRLATKIYLSKLRNNGLDSFQYQLQDRFPAGGVDGHKFNMNTVIMGKRIQIRRKDYRMPRGLCRQTDGELAKLDAATPLEMTYQRYLSEYGFELSYPNANRCEFAVDTLDGEHIGNCVYYNVNPSEGQAEMGIMIGNRDYWNQGYGSEIINTFLDYIFNDIKLNRIYLTTLTWNIRAQKCFKKCGFKKGDDRKNHYTFILMSIYRD